MARWLEQLEEYDFENVHRQGKLHNNADAKSHLPYMNCESDIPDVSVVANTSLLPVTQPRISELDSWKITLLDLF